MGNMLVALLLLWVVWRVLTLCMPGPSRAVLRWLKRFGRSLWDVVYRKAAVRRGRAFGILWLLCVLWLFCLVGVIAQGGEGWTGLLIFALCIGAYKLALAWWERRAAARVQRPLPHREQW